MKQLPTKKLTDLKTLCTALKCQQRFLLACHVAPEGDAIGSLLAMDSLLRRLGKQTCVVNEDPFPERLPCLSSKRWHQPEQIKKSPDYFDALVTTDCPTLERIGKVRNLIGPKTVIFNIDHHISNNLFGHYNYVLPQASASGEVVFEIFKHMKLKLTREEAKNIYVAITTDTGSFKYSTTTVNSHLVAAELMSSGIDIEKINDQIHSSYSLNKMQLYSRLMGRVTTTSCGRVAWVALRLSDLKASGSTYEDTEGFIDFLRYMREVHISFFITELSVGSVKVSFRAKGPYDVNRIATDFGGGGHRKASGCSIKASPDEAEALILRAVRKHYPHLFV
jgi:phosphoesterase RecJ-like protein